MVWSQESPGCAMDDPRFESLHINGLFYQTSRLDVNPTPQPPTQWVLEGSSPRAWSQESPGCALDDPRFESLHINRLFYQTSRLDVNPTPQPPTQWVLGSSSPRAWSQESPGCALDDSRQGTFLSNIQTGCDPHPLASYSMGIGGFFPHGIKLITRLCQVARWRISGITLL